MRLIKKIKRFFFGIHEIIWVVVHEIENWLYPYCDRPVEYEYDEDTTSEISFLKAQMESANERIQRLQTEMIHVQSTVDSLTDKRKIIIKNK